MVSAVSSDCFCGVALRVLMMALLLFTSKLLVSRTGKRPSDNKLSAWGLVGLGITLQRTNNCPVVGAHHSSQGYQVFRPSLYQICPRIPRAQPTYRYLCRWCLPLS